MPNPFVLASQVQSNTWTIITRWFFPSTVACFFWFMPYNNHITAVAGFDS